MTAAAPILEPGRNCYRIGRARRASVLVDAANYFACLDTVFRRARRSILIIGWDFDAGIVLRPGDGGETLGHLLRSLLEERPELEIRILVWNLSTLHAPGETLPLIFGAKWQEHPRIQLWLDHNHPIYGAQHQKLVCVDDCVAFVGGIDLTVGRWDTCDHLPEDEHRTAPDGTVHEPVHDTQMIVDGEAAAVVASVAQHRWRQATTERLTLDPGGGDLWPPNLTPDFTNVPVAISRTIPASGGDAEVREIRALTEDALRAAKDAIYIEAQYLADPNVADILGAHLAAERGPEIFVVVAHAAKGILERLSMSANRDRLIRRLRRADRFGRFRTVYPVVAEPGGDCEVFIHSKLMIVDDRFLKIGSANLNRRSTGLDTECDVSIEATDGPTRQGIAGIRAALLGEHLGADPARIAAAIDQEGSLLRAIDRLNNQKRRLRSFDDIGDKGPVRLAPLTRLLDPARPFRLLPRFRRRRPQRHS
jgi:phosphatidylserine/phosphatidylglycerophosphate/cardiolipin synthase-like enzyme